MGYGEEAPDQLLANPHNWRIHPKYQQDALAGVLDEVGWITEVTVNQRTGYVVDGHLRVAMAISKGEATVPVKYVDLSEEEEALVIATLDPISALAVADAEVLADLLEQVSTEDAVIQRLLDEIAAEAGIGAGDPPEDPGVKWDKAEEIQKKWQVQRGQIWEIPSSTSRGIHRLMCGDSTGTSEVAKLMEGTKAVLGFTSPPYWVGKEYETQTSISEINEFIAKAVAAYNFAVRKDKSRIVINTSTGFTTSFERKKKRQVLLLIDKWVNAFYETGWNLRHIRHWLKEGQLRSTSPRSDLIDQHCEFLGTFEADEGEPMIFDDMLSEHDIGLLETFYNAGGTTRGQERTKQKWALRSYWADIHGAAGGAGHCASFPVELAARHILLYTRPGELVLDLFVGAGTSVVAAEQLKRVAYGMDLEPKYLALALERLAGMGLEPRLAG